MISHQQLITKQQFGIVYIPRLSTPQQFSILSPTIRQPFSMVCNVTATFPHDRRTFGNQFRNGRHSSASYSATSDSCRRFYRKLRMTLRECMRIHAERARWQRFAHLLINKTERFPKLAKFYRQPFCKASGLQWTAGIRHVWQVRDISLVLKYSVLTSKDMMDIYERIVSAF